jgi:hypothetical protein
MLPDKIIEGKLRLRKGCTCTYRVRRTNGQRFRGWVMSQDCPHHGFDPNTDFYYIGDRPADSAPDGT